MDLGIVGTIELYVNTMKANGNSIIRIIRNFFIEILLR